MFRLSRSKFHPIGIDIGHDSIKLLQLEQVDGERLIVHAAARESLSAEAKAQPQLRLACAVEQVKRMLATAGFRGRRAVAALPRELVLLKSIRLPMMPVHELAQAAQLEAASLFNFNTDEAQVRAIPAGEVRQGADVLQEVILVAARNQDVDNFVEQVHRCGVMLESLDVEPCALFRSVERFIRRRSDEQQVHALVDVGYGGTQVVIGRGREISFIKAIEIGAQHLHSAIAQALGIPADEAAALHRRVSTQNQDEASNTPDAVRQAVHDAVRGTIEQLAREISLCLRYQAVTFRGQRPSRMRLVGGEGGNAQLIAAMKALVTIPIEEGRPLFKIDAARMQPADRRGSMAEWAVALGLAMRRIPVPGNSSETTVVPAPGEEREPAAERSEDTEPVIAGEVSDA